jgi:hypothetical protein
VEREIDEYLEATGAMRNNNSAALLYHDLFSPIRELASKRQLIVVPDGKLASFRLKR